ncbi:MAG: 2-hydroxyacyl-CoA dehydratase family protein [Dehalococcoidia bacterium]
MSVTKVHKGLAYAHELAGDRGLRARELKAGGKKIVGHFCCSVPLELFTALDIVPYRILGNIHEPITKADAHLEASMCAFVRSCLDLSLKGKYDLLDGFVGIHACDSIQRVYDIWNYCHGPDKYKYAHFIDMPHVVRPGSLVFFKKQIEFFKKSLEAYAGRTMSNADLTRAIKLHNENHRLLRKLYDLRKEDPPLVSGSEVMEVTLAGMSIPVQEYNQLVNDVIAEVTARKPQLPKGGTRILVYGTLMDDTTLTKVVENAGGHVVIDDSCTGTRAFWHDVVITDDPLDGLAKHYLDDIPCPRTYRDFTGSHHDDVENRFHYLNDFVTDFKVNGVILSIVRFCDLKECDAPDIRDYLQELGLPVLHLGDAYDSTASGQLRTRVEAFLEMTNMERG